MSCKYRHQFACQSFHRPIDRSSSSYIAYASLLFVFLLFLLPVLTASSPEPHASTLETSSFCATCGSSTPASSPVLNSPVEITGDGRDGICTSAEGIGVKASERTKLLSCHAAGGLSKSQLLVSVTAPVTADLKITYRADDGRRSSCMSWTPWSALPASLSTRRVRRDFPLIRQQWRRLCRLTAWKS